MLSFVFEKKTGAKKKGTQNKTGTTSAYIFPKKVLILQYTL